MAIKHLHIDVCVYNNNDNKILLRFNAKLKKS